MAKRDISSLRSTLEFLKKEPGEVLTIKREIDPICEISGMEKKLEGGPTLLFENIKGYSGVRNVGNLFSQKERIARIFGVEDHRKMKFKCLQAMKNPLPPRVVSDAPCQEVVITEDIDVKAMMPIIQHTPLDAGRILGGGIFYIGGKHSRGGTQLSFHRTHFRSKDGASVLAFYGTHLGETLLEHRGEKIPATINIGTPPAVTVVGGGAVMHTIIPRGTDKVAIAGGLQGFPVDLVKARTVDTHAIAQSEWVIEGYFDTNQKVWESDDAEKLGKGEVALFFPEWTGYNGKSIRTFKFQATAITRRKEQPIFFTPLAHSLEGEFLIMVLREACFYERADRLMPGLVEDVNIMSGITGRAGVIFQVRKKRAGDEGYQKNLITAAFGATQGLHLVVVVDEDIDIYSAEDLLWAITTRVRRESDILSGSAGGRGGPMMPIERIAVDGKTVFHYDGGLGIDATVPFESKQEFARCHYPVDKIDLKKWLSEEEIVSAQQSQNEYAKVLSRIGA